MTRARAVFAIAAGTVALACTLGACATSSPVGVQTFAPPAAPVTAISNEGYQALLARYVGENGKVDYARWKDSAADVRALDGYLSTLTSATPETRPDLFKTPTDKLSYWINLYNALVLREILRRWPVDSVTGKGFFYDLEVVVGGQAMNLHDIENKILRAQFKDARIHFAINCGSSSCAVLPKEAFDPSSLEAQLDEAAARFINDGKDVVVDDAKKEVVLSKLFDWYADDFVVFAKQRANLKEAGVVDFVLLYATEPLATKLRAAKANGYRVVFLAYDWNVNKQ